MERQRSSPSSLHVYILLFVLAQVSAAFRIEVLSEVPGMSQRAVERLSRKLNAAAATGESIEIGEELRHLTLQVVNMMSRRWN